MKKAIRTLTVALCCLILIFTTAAPAFAADFNPYAKNSLEIIFQADKDTLVPGADFHIYRVGAVDESGNIYSIEPYGYYPVLITEVDNVSGNLGAALALKGFVLAENIALRRGPTATVYASFMTLIRASILSIPTLVSMKAKYIPQRQFSSACRQKPLKANGRMMFR